ncbi:TPA: hypothetical protein LU109_003548 [Enterobacter hormaechei subsp. xiangfangensis]|nr:hypothetical protein [Enterobacter hormaechei subsp. xiangfangensis]
MSSNDAPQLVTQGDDNQTTWIMAFREKGLMPTGRKEVTGLRDIDRALGNHICDALKGLFVTDETRHNRALARFAERPPEDQLVIGHFDDLKDLVRSIRQARAGRPSKAADKFSNPDALPLMNLTRTLDLSWGYQERQLDREDYATILDRNTGKTRFLVATLPVLLTYNLTIVSADKEPLAMLANYMAHHFYRMHSTTIIAKVPLAGLAVDVECALNNLKGTVGTDVSLPIGEERLFGVQISIDLIADTMVAHEVMEIPKRVEVGLKVMDQHPIVVAQPVDGIKTNRRP